MADRPIIFSGPMVRALIDGRKTQTRRVLSPDNLRIWTGGLDYGGRHVKPNPVMFEAALNNARKFRLCDDILAWITDPAPHQHGAVMAQWQGRLKYVVGDLLWVREAYFQRGHWEPVEGAITKGGRQKWAFAPAGDEVLFDRPHGITVRLGRHHRDPATDAWHQRPGRFMPRWASRLTLRVTDVRVQRLQEISEEEAIAEGLTRLKATGRYVIGQGDQYLGCASHDPREVYSWLWDSINAKRGMPWAANPFVVALTFDVIKSNIDTVLKEAAHA